MTNIRLAIENRKAAAQRLAEITGEASRYTKVPRCAYEVGPFFLEKDGSITVTEGADLQPLRTLAEEGLLEPFEAGADQQAQDADMVPTEPDDADSAGEDAALTISLPMDGFNPDALDRLVKLVDSKATLIRKALNATRLTIHTEGDKVSFPWWDTMADTEETQAFMSFIAALGKMAREAKRVTAKEAEVESEKYAFRCFLIRLGFVGEDFKVQRKILMHRLSGSAAFPSREKADAFSAAQKARRDTDKPTENKEVSVCE